MAKTAKVAWGIDVGNCALKAVKLGLSGDRVVVLDYAVFEHEKILSQPEVTSEQRREMVGKALNNFLENHTTAGASIVVSIPGQSSFARFVKMPPVVEKKRIADMVRYEAEQQIPFPINDVEWDWQSFEDPGNSDVEVGIFAIKSDLVKMALTPFTEARCLINTVQISPMAIYNYFRYEQAMGQSTSGKEAVICLNIGADNTDLVISDGVRVWQRSIAIGGNQFTAAVQKSFKLSFAKAENIKRTASTSQYARQIFQAMRPVFADLAAEIQRSLGFYSSSNRDVQYHHVLAMGNAIKLPGLIKFLQQSLSLPVKRLDAFEGLELNEEISVADFTAQASSLPVAIGLALQGVGRGTINSNLLPREIVRQTAWQRKRTWFIAACATFVFSAILCFFQATAQSGDIKNADSVIGRATTNKSKVDAVRSELDSVSSEIETAKTQRDHYYNIIKDPARHLSLDVLQALYGCLPNEEHNPAPQAVELYQAYQKGERERVITMPRSQRPQVFLTSVQAVYTDDLNKNFEEVVQSGAGMGMPGMGMGMGAAAARGGTPAGMMGGMDPAMMGGRDAMLNMGGMPSAAPTAAPVEKKPGFVIIVEGFTPHGGGLKFLAPPEVGLDRSKWGFFDRLRHLGLTDSVLAGERPVSLPASDYQKKQSQWAESLPFEAYTVEGQPALSFFDATENGFISGFVDNPRQPNPFGFGIPKVDSRSSAAGMMGMGMGMGMGGGMGMDAAMMGGMTGGGPGEAARSLPEFLDRFTFEPISDIYRRDPKGDVVYDATGKPVIEHHDTWFRVKFKMILKKDKAATGAVDSGVESPAAAATDI